MYILHFFVHGLRGEDTGVSTVYDGLRRSTTTLGIYDSAEKRAIGSLFEIPSQIRSVYAFLRGPPIFGNSKPNKKRLRVFAHGADLHPVRPRATSCALVRPRASPCEPVRARATSCALVRPGAPWCDLVRPRATSCDHVRLRATSCALARPCATSCDLVRPRAASCDHVRPRTASCDLVRPRATSCDRV